MKVDELVFRNIITNEVYDLSDFDELEDFLRSIVQAHLNADRRMENEIVNMFDDILDSM